MRPTVPAPDEVSHFEDSRFKHPLGHFAKNTPLCQDGFFSFPSTLPFPLMSCFWNHEPMKKHSMLIWETFGAEVLQIINGRIPRRRAVASGINYQPCQKEKLERLQYESRPGKLTDCNPPPQDVGTLQGGGLESQPCQYLCGCLWVCVHAPGWSALGCIGQHMSL